MYFWFVGKLCETINQLAKTPLIFSMRVKMIATIHLKHKALHGHYVNNVPAESARMKVKVFKNCRIYNAQTFIYISKSKSKIVRRSVIYMVFHLTT